MGRRVLHTGELGSASQLKVMTNFLASANLIAVTEALAACAKVGLDLGIAYEAIAASSGNSFVHETEGQVILNGSRDINFAMDLVKKDVGLFIAMAKEAGMEWSWAILWRRSSTTASSATAHVSGPPTSSSAPRMTTTSKSSLLVSLRRCLMMNPRNSLVRSGFATSACKRLLPGHLAIKTE